ncbi:MAG: amino acid racemase [Micrococcales bacterium]|nr:amino acid racemase [Micrococcales bacterium]
MTLRTVGLLGGMTYHSTVDYYKDINDQVAAALGGLTSAPMVLDSINFAEYAAMQKANQWDQLGEMMAGRAQRLEAAGAQGIAICTNLMHKVAPAVQAAVTVPLLHIVEAVATQAKAKGIRRLGILGAPWTMTEDWYSDPLITAGLEVVRANDQDIETNRRVIFDELGQGIISDKSRDDLVKVIERLASAGADGVALSCTELPLILSDRTSPLPTVNSTVAHVQACTRFILN